MNTYAQEPKTSTADLAGAKSISVNQKYSFSASPIGYGTIQEYRIDPRRPPIFFKEERNSIWLTMEAPFSGSLSFKITPHQAVDDYDWMLFENTADLSAQIKAGSAKLLRSNNSRNDLSLSGTTGLSQNSSVAYEGPGPGRSFSSLITLQKGQKLALIIDNIYNGGKGFDFESKLTPYSKISRTVIGTVSDKVSKMPLPATLICEDDSTGVKLSESKADPEGKYFLTIPGDRPVNITATSHGYVFKTEDIKAESKNIVQNFDLEKLSSAAKILLFNIHFTPDKDLIKSNSAPELERLINLLKQEKEWEVRVIGHTNNNPFADARYLQKLSFNRALAVKQYLVANGVSEKRISCAGMGGKSPLIVTKNSEEGLKNLRVEVVLSRR